MEESTDPRVEPHIKILFYAEGEGHIYTWHNGRRLKVRCFDLILEPWTFLRKCAAEIAWNCIDSQWNKCTSLQLRFVSLLTSQWRKSECKPSVIKIMSTSTSPSEIYTLNSSSVAYCMYTGEEFRLRKSTAK